MRTSTKYELTLGDVPCFLAYFLNLFLLDEFTINRGF